MIRKNVSTRERISDEIIDHRVKDLLNPDLQWEQTPGQESATSNLRPKASTTARRPRAKNKSDLVPVPVNWMHRSASAIIWGVLGLKVEQVTPESVGPAGYRGGLLIAEVRREPPVENLRAGDIIVGLDKWQVVSNFELAWTLLQPLSKNVAIQNPVGRATTEKALIHVLRDDQPLSFEVELPPWPPDATNATPPARNASTIASPTAARDLSSSRAIAISSAPVGADHGPLSKRPLSAQRSARGCQGTRRSRACRGGES